MGRETQLQGACLVGLDLAKARERERISDAKRPFAHAMRGLTWMGTNHSPGWYGPR